MQIICWTKDKKLFQKISEKLNREIFPFDSDALDYVSSIVIIDAETIGKEDVESHLDRCLLFGDGHVIIVRPIKYTLYGQYSVISKDLVVADSLDNVMFFVDELLKEKDEMICFGSWMLNTRTKVLYRNGFVVQRLYDKAFFMLVELLLHRNELVSRKSIVEKVWEEDTFRKNRSFDAYMVGIKHLFDDDDDINIEMVYGKGYIFHCK